MPPVFLRRSVQVRLAVREVVHGREVRAREQSRYRTPSRGCQSSEPRREAWTGWQDRATPARISLRLWFHAGQLVNVALPPTRVVAGLGLDARRLVPAFRHSRKRPIGAAFGRSG